MNKLKPLIVFATVAGILSIVLVAVFFKSTTPKASGNVNGWRLLVNGLVQNPLNLTFNELATMPTTTVNAVLYCVDSPNNPLAQGNWTGVRLSLLLEKARISQDAVKVAFTADDGYITDLTLTTAMRNDVILAYERNSELLPEKLRLVVPGKWGYKWISGINHIEIVNFDFKGFWESRGYSDDADIPSTP